MRITNLRTNHLTDPVGYTLSSLTFTWTTEADTGLKQKAARIIVGKNETVLLDTGLSASISSLGYTADIALEPRTKYWWTVEVVADDGETAVSEKAYFETAKLDEPWAAQWIAAPFENTVHPLIGKSFTLPAKPVRARVYGVGLGLYELNVNGVKAGDEVLAPFYNDYRFWVQYQTYDVTDLLHEGENRLEAMLGNGWYKGRFGFDEHIEHLFGDSDRLLLELHAELADGTEVVLGTDTSWVCMPSPVLDSNIYDGETYDARLEGKGEWVPAVPADAPEGALTARLSPPLRVCDTVKPVSLIHTPADEQVIDFGQIMTGWVEFDADLPEGCELTLQYGEILQNDCFYRDNLRTALEEYHYISAGKKAHVRPFFTFYGFRYVKVTGLETIDLNAFTGCVIHSDLTVTGSIETSNEKVNKLFKNAFWGQIGNFVDVPTDCPQRDERMGWTGDAHIFAPTASFNMYTPAFYHKYLQDMRFEQRTLDGSVPHVVPDILTVVMDKRKDKPGFGASGSCAWGDVATGMPWTLWNFYGDKSMLKAHYENMKLWTDWIRKQDDTYCGGKRLWMCGFHFADWLALDTPIANTCLGGTDPYYIASAFYYFSASTTAKAAEVLGYEEDAKTYSALAEEIKAAFRKEFITATGRVSEPTQTAMVMALHLGLIPDEFRDRLKDDLRKRIALRNDHLDTGFVGTYYICRTLSENGMNDLAYTLLLNEDFPSWLYEVNMGATTVWERWNSVLPDGSISDTGMNSLNHYAYGSIVEWMYRCMCGLNPAQPGFKRARIAPMSDPRFTHAKAVYDSASGRYESGWMRSEEGTRYEVTVPFDAEADFVPETTDGTWALNGKSFDPKDGCVLLPGRHVIEYRK